MSADIQLRTICEKCCGNGYEGGDRTRPCLLCGQLGYVYRWVPLEEAIHEAHVEATKRTRAARETGPNVAEMGRG